MQYVKELTNNRIILGAGTVYSSIGKLEGDCLIDTVREEDRRKIYRITDEGMMILREEALVALIIPLVFYSETLSSSDIFQLWLAIAFFSVLTLVLGWIMLRINKNRDL